MGSLLIKLAVHIAAFCVALPCLAVETTFVLNPAQSRVDFTLGATLHTVHGAFRLRRGTLRFDPATGQAGGELVVDADSGASGSQARDKRMKRDILETAQFPDIIFRPQHIKGAVPGSGSAQVELDGVLTLHGEDHPMELTVPLTVSGNQAAADVRFAVPYVQWGMKNPSTFVLRVSDTVTVDVHAVGQFFSASAAANP